MLKITKYEIVKVILLSFTIFCSCFFYKSYGATNEVVQSVELNNENNWNANVTLPKYSDKGEKINYSIQEKNDVKGYSSSVDKFTITNTLNEAKVIIRYFDKMTNKEIEKRTEETGYVGLEYSTNSIEINGYTLVGNSKNVSGVMTKDNIYVDYFYLYNCDINVKHIDKSTGKILEEENYNGLEGEKLTSSSKDLLGYKLVKKPESEEHSFTKEQQNVEYYYLKLGNLTINKVDKENNKILNGTARFEIYDENNNKLYFIKKDKNYIVSDGKTNLDYVETTNGQVKVKNIVVGKYKIKEIKAPDGYFLLNNAKEIEITNNNLDFKVDIINKKVFFLPLSGGKGIITTIIGSFLICIGIILFTYRKMKERKNEI